MAYDLYTMYKHNTVRIYHRRGARRWKKVRRINGHAFVAKRFQMAFCDKCEDRIWGLGRQGYRCESCKMTVHKRCCYYLKQDNICKGHPVSGLSLTSLRLSPTHPSLSLTTQHPPPPSYNVYILPSLLLLHLTLIIFPFFPSLPLLFATASVCPAPFLSSPLSYHPTSPQIYIL